MRKRRLALQHWYEPGSIYWCAFCNNEIAHVGFDPVRVVVEAARGTPSGAAGSWVFWAHALCVRDAFDPDFAHDIPRDWYSGDA